MVDRAIFLHDHPVPTFHDKLFEREKEIFKNVAEDMLSAKKLACYP